MGAASDRGSVGAPQCNGPLEGLEAECPLQGEGQARRTPPHPGRVAAALLESGAEMQA